VINTETRILGILGFPLGHSLSPLMHNRALQSLGLNYVYVAFAVARHFLADAVKGLRGLGVAGVNVTVPFKEEILPYLDELSTEAQACQAVNVVKNCQGRLVGYNTDGPGFMAALTEAGVTPAGQRIVLLGAGGAARAVAYQLGRAGSQHITCVNRTRGKAEQLAEFITGQTGVPASAAGWDEEEVEKAVQAAGMLVNTTPVGMFPATREMPPVNPEWFHHELVVCDVIYNPAQTRLLLAARQRGLRTVDGVGMFVHQGALAFEIFTGCPAPVKLMREVVVGELAR